jgi:uncharacterized membrane protein
MKKVLLVSVLCLFCATNLFAGSPVTVKSGNVSILKTPEKALLEIDYSAAKVGNISFHEYLKGKGDDYVRDWPRESATAASYFKATFNKKSKGLTLTTDETAATYKIVINVKNLDMGDAGTSIVNAILWGAAAGKAGGVIMSGPIEIIDLNTNNTVLTLYVDEVKGGGAVNDAIRVGNMYSELALKICKLKVK